MDKTLHFQTCSDNVSQNEPKNNQMKIVIINYETKIIVCKVYEVSDDDFKV